MSLLKHSSRGTVGTVSIDIHYYDVLVDSADRYFKQRSFHKAEMLLHTVDDACPPVQKKRSLLLLSRIYRRRSQYAQMSGPLMRASAAFPRDLAVMTALADWHGLIGDSATAVQLWKEIYLREKKKRVKESTCVRYACALRDNGEIDLARSVLAEAIVHFPRSPNLYLELAALGDSDDCMADLLRYSRNALLLSIAEQAESQRYDTVRRVIQLLSSSFRAIEEGSKNSVSEEGGEKELSVTVCLIVQNEAKYLLEWIAYYQTLGFDEILVYDNETSDGSEKLLRELAELSLIELVDWPNMPRQPAQFAAYEDALTRCKTEWIAFLDIDEFLLLKKHGHIKEFLKGFSPTVGGVAVNWKIFGSGGAREYGPELVIERFTRCGHPDRFGWQVKSIVRRRGAQFASNHVCRLRKGFTYVDASGREYTGDGQACYDDAQVNHYAIKSWSEFLDKTHRGRANIASDSGDNFFGDDPKGTFDVYDQNEIVDEEILRHKGAVLERIDALTKALSRPKPQ
jgi:hypothetical protein